MTLNKVLRTIVYTGIFLLPLMPLMVSTSMFFPFITAKNIAFRFIVEIIAASWFALALRDPSYRPRRSWLFMAIGIFIAIIGAANLFGVNPYSSFWSNFERMEGYITILHLGAYFIVASSILRTEELWKRFFQTSMAVSAVMVIYSVFQLLGWITINQGGLRLDGRLGNATYLAIYMLFHIFLAALFLLRHRGGKGMRWLYALLIAAQTFILVFTASRGVMLGLIFGSLIAAFLIVLFERSPARQRLRKGAGAALLFIVGTVGLFVAVRNMPAIRNHEIFSRFASISLSEGFSRFQIWDMAIQGFKERPILGWGQGNFDVVFNKYYDPAMYTQEPWFDRTHNIIFDWLVAGGILGLLAYLAMYAGGLVLLWRRTPNNTLGVTEKALITGLLAGYFLQLLFVFDNITSYFLFFSVLAYIHAMLGKPTGAWWNSLVQPNGALQRIAPAVVVVGLAFVVYTVNVKPLLAARSLIQSLVAHPGGAQENLSRFRKTIAYNTFGNAEAREQLAQATLEVLAAEESVVPQNLKEQFVSYAVLEMRTQTQLSPLSARAWFFLGSFLRRLGRNDEAREVLNKARELSPDKQVIAFERGLTEAAAGKPDEALAILKKAYDDAPAYDDARIFYTVIAIRNKKFDIADALLSGEEGAVAASDDRVLRAYLDAGQMQKVVAILEGKIEKDPKNLEGYVSLAAAYIQVKNTKKAIETLERAIVVDPSFKGQGEKYISDIKSGKI